MRISSSEDCSIIFVNNICISGAINRNELAWLAVPIQNYVYEMCFKSLPSTNSATSVQTLWYQSQQHNKKRVGL